MKSLMVKSDTRLFQVLFLKNDRYQRVYVDEVEEVDLTEIKKHLEAGESVFITSREEQKLESRLRKTSVVRLDLA